MDPHEELMTSPPIRTAGPHWRIAQQSVHVPLRSRDGEFVEGPGVRLDFGQSTDDASRQDLKITIPDGSYILIHAHTGGGVITAEHHPKRHPQERTGRVSEADRIKREEEIEESKRALREHNANAAFSGGNPQAYPANPNQEPYYGDDLGRPYNPADALKQYDPTDPNRRPAPVNPVGPFEQRPLNETTGLTGREPDVQDPASGRSIPRQRHGGFNDGNPNS